MKNNQITWKVKDKLLDDEEAAERFAMLPKAIRIIVNQMRSELMETYNTNIRIEEDKDIQINFGTVFPNIVHEVSINATFTKN